MRSEHYKHTQLRKKRITQKHIENTQKIRRREMNSEEPKEAHCIVLFVTTVEKGGRTSRYPLIPFFSSLSFFLFFFFFPSLFLPSFHLFLLVSCFIHFNSLVNLWSLVRLLEFYFFCKYLVSIFFIYNKKQKKIKKKNKKNENKNKNYY